MVGLGANRKTENDIKAGVIYENDEHMFLHESKGAKLSDEIGRHFDCWMGEAGKDLTVESKEVVAEHEKTSGAEAEVKVRENRDCSQIPLYGELSKDDLDKEDGGSSITKALAELRTVLMTFSNVDPGKRVKDTTAMIDRLKAAIPDSWMHGYKSPPVANLAAGTTFKVSATASFTGRMTANSLSRRAVNGRARYSRDSHHSP